MFRDIEFLLQLQEIDLRIHEQELAKEQLPATVKDLELAVSKAQKGLETAKTKLAEAEKELKNFDDQILAAQQGLERSQERLNSIKTNREYDAVHAEIETQKNMVATSEGRKNKLTEEVSQLKAAVDVAQQEIDKVTAENSPVIADLTSKISAIDSVIADIVKERDAVIPSISKSSIRTYEQILKRRKTAKVISKVDRLRTCTVCFKVLEPHIISEVRRSTKLMLCQNCGSILVWTDNRGQGSAPEV
jgi:predicted  nucleic acid-binding Zn-ribbon protein